MANRLRLILSGERFFHNFQKFGNNWRYASIYGGVLSLFVKFSTRKKIKFVEFHTFGKKKIRKILRIETLREANVENLEEKKSFPVRMTLIT